MKLAVYAVLVLLAACSWVSAKVVVPPPPPAPSLVNQLSFRDNCALIALHHVLETAGTDNKQSAVLAAWDLADQMEKERLNRLR